MTLQLDYSFLIKEYLLRQLSGAGVAQARCLREAGEEKRIRSKRIK
jgi:hypothetical protein